jgi:hypothetical protein
LKDDFQEVLDNVVENIGSGGYISGVQGPALLDHHFLHLKVEACLLLQEGWLVDDASLLVREQNRKIDQDLLDTTHQPLRWLTHVVQEAGGLLVLFGPKLGCGLCETDQVILHNQRGIALKLWDVVIESN